ncbi:hypothetical protein ACO0QE_001983 [Hanseniaspora vineae]
MSNMSSDQMALLHHLKSKNYVNQTAVRYFQELVKLEKDHTRRVSALQEKYMSVFTKTTPDSGKMQQQVILDFINLQKKMVHKQGKLEVYMEKDIIPEFNTYQMDAGVSFKTYETKMVKLMEHKESLEKMIRTVQDKLDKVQVKVRECELNCYNQLGIKESEAVERNRGKWKLVEQELLGKLDVLQMDYKKLKEHCEIEWQEAQREMEKWENDRVKHLVDVYYQYAGLKMEYDRIEGEKLEVYMNNATGVVSDIIQPPQTITTSKARITNHRLQTNATNERNTNKMSATTMGDAAPSPQISRDKLSETAYISPTTNGNVLELASATPNPPVPPKDHKAEVYQETLRKLSDQLGNYQDSLQQAECSTRVSSFEIVGEESHVDKTYYPYNQTIDVLQEKVDVVIKETRGENDYNGLDFSANKRNSRKDSVSGFNKKGAHESKVHTPAPRSHTSPKKVDSSPSRNHTFNDSSLMEITQQDFIDETAHPDTTIINNYMYSKDEEDDESRACPAFNYSPERPKSYANTSVTTIESQHSRTASVTSTSPSTANEAYFSPHAQTNNDKHHNISPPKDAKFFSSTTFSILKSIPDMEKASSSWNKKSASKQPPPLPTREPEFEDRSSTASAHSRATSVSTTKINSSPQRVRPVTQVTAQPVMQPVPQYIPQPKQMNPPPTMSSPSLGLSNNNKPMGNATPSGNVDPLKVAVERMRRERDARKQKQLQEKEFLKQQREQVMKMVGDGVAQLEQEQADYGRISSVTGAKLVPFTKK